MGSGASRRVLEKERASKQDVGNLESLLTMCVHRLELRSSEESLVGAGASTDTLLGVPKISSFVLAVVSMLEFLRRSGVHQLVWH